MALVLSPETVLVGERVGIELTTPDPDTGQMRATGRVLAWLDYGVRLESIEDGSTQTLVSSGNIDRVFSFDRS